MTEIVQHLELSQHQARGLHFLLAEQGPFRKASKVFLNLESNGDLIVSSPLQEHPYTIRTIKRNGTVAR
jgi:hypothetical protein